VAGTDTRTSTATITITGSALITTTFELLGAGPLLRLLHLCSPALPIGAFAYSQGLEPAVTLAWVRDEEHAKSWIVGQLRSQLGHLDLPVLARLYAAWGEHEASADDASARAAAAWSKLLMASRPSAELQAEERHLGASLARVVAGLGLPEAAAWIGREDVTYAAMFALAARRWDVPVAAAAQGFAFAWAEQQTSAAVRLVPLGQTAGQRILSAAAAVIPEVVARALELPDDEIGAAAPRLAAASAWHETQYSRLFRS
jgi:urease accessory protein